jgi:hypothetical protein
MTTSDRPALPSNVRRALEKVLKYIWHDEAWHYPGGREKDHIFRQLVVVRNWLDGTKRSSDDFACEELEITREELITAR